MSNGDSLGADTERWEKRYVDNDLPWDTGEPDGHLVAFVRDEAVTPCRVLDVGCGTGTNALFLRRLGFDVCGVDLSRTAIDRARERASHASAECRFEVVDFLSEPVPGGPFGMVYDRGCFHSFDEPEIREQYASRVSEALVPGGTWLSLIGSTDSPPTDAGPPRRSAAQITLAVEPHFEIVRLEASIFDRGRFEEARAWVLVGRRRAGA
ncbi:MAG: class I SAM-dependent methyltransferase [Gemmatimonadota bacterium]|jgi:SAM-dependent methyltransferase|nr:methyltransferase type 11 [Gemmatimonadota bacterium]MDP6461233.1 class I SAM-dependent methyltransferase [Gemmatimonadota bacterium]MDP6528441.1 class I SAM-dependent methyltransferase [Gemmatimonadota bacterium]MDP6802942.1 class I SAM-dependent methyltransferase [Gemmatimonadota bacterium]MDP7031239.1 class I SAM-dependent methyltransferase [Gemmatimonadota bacterium]